MRRDAAGWVVMAVALALALAGAWAAVDAEQREAELRFERAADALARALVERVDDCGLALRAAGALLDAGGGVEPDTWRRFVEDLQRTGAPPGLLELGFARRVEPEALPAASPGAMRVVVRLVAPPAAGDGREPGVDLAADPIRRAALELARDTGRAALSGGVPLGPGHGVDGGRRGVLLFLPVRGDDAPRVGPDPAPRGFAFASLRLDALAAGLQPPDRPPLAFELYDGERVHPDALLHASAPIGDAVRTGLRRIDLPGRRWTLRAAGTAAFEQASRSQRPALVAAVGALGLLALLAFVRGDARERRRVDAEAGRLASEVAGRRVAERAMRDSERRFREVVEASPIGLLMVERDGRIALANPQVERLFGYARGELLGRPVETLVPDGLREPHAARRADFQRAPHRRRVGEGGDVHGLRRDGTRLPVEIGLNPVGDPDAGRVLASIADVSARDAEQRQLQSMLREKTVLLDEVHHRVKNNLQVITSLLSLQARSAPPEARAALAECRNRVHAMALTHQLLHENADVARLHVGEYLTRLARLLADAHRAGAPRVSLHVEGADTPLYLALPRAIPCGLLVNELVTHAYRHAFAPDGAGTIVVGLAIEGGLARLWVADDGVARGTGGAPDGDARDAHPPGEAADPPEAARPLAWQLVPLLVDQLGGTLARADGPGTRFDVTFPVDDGARR